MKCVLNLLAVIAASIVHLISGPTLINIGRVHTRLFTEMEMELPLISKASAAYTGTIVPMIVGLILGVATLLGLGFVYRSERIRWLLPVMISISFVVAILHIMFVSFGATLPLVRITSTMGH